MNFLIFALLIAAPGCLLAHRLLRERSRFVVAALGFPLGLVGLLSAANLALRLGLSLGASLALTALAFVVVSAIVIRKRPSPGFIADELNPLTWLFLVSALCLIVLFCNWYQFQCLDDDFWIHTPIQAELLKGGYPLRNPFFPELFLNGHFGRDLLIVCFTYLTGYTTYWSQMAFTVAANVSLFLLFFATFWRFTGSRAQAATATGFIYFGVNMAQRVGCFDAFTNNNTAANLWMCLMCYMALKIWEEERLTPAMMGGVVLGSYGVVYETHFGLSILATVFTAGTLAVLRPLKVPQRDAGESRSGSISRRALGLTILMLVLAIPQASTQGGVLTDLCRRKLLGSAQTPTAMGLLNQSQSAELHFPKKNLFCIREAWNEYQPVSCIYRRSPTDRLLAFFTRSKRTGYTYSPILSRQVLKMHWLALYLSPLSLGILIWARHRAGLWLWFFGMASYLVPAVVDFGPIHECEYFRWEFAASMGLAGALGLAAAWLTARLAGDPGFRFSFQARTSEEPSVNERRARRWARTLKEAIEGRFSASVSGRLVLWAPLGILIWLNTLAAFPTVLTFLQGPWTLPESAFLNINIRNWVDSEGKRYGFSDADYLACEWLATQVTPGRQRLLLNFPHQSPNDVFLESFILGSTGAYSVGHMLPLDSDPIGTPPFRMTAETGQFWITPTAAILKNLHPDWIMLRFSGDFTPMVQATLESLPGVKKVYDVGGGRTERRVIYAVKNEP